MMRIIKELEDNAENKNDGIIEKDKIKKSYFFLHFFLTSIYSRDNIKIMVLRKKVVDL